MEKFVGDGVPMHLSTFADRRNVNTTCDYHHLYQASLVSQDIEISDKTNTGILDTYLQKCSILWLWVLFPEKME